MGDEFSGWPERAFDLLLELEGDPPEIVRESLRESREQLIRRPMIMVMQQLADADRAYADFSVPGFRKTIEPWQRQVGFVRPEPSGRSPDLRARNLLNGRDHKGLMPGEKIDWAPR